MMLNQFKKIKKTQKKHDRESRDHDVESKEDGDHDSDSDILHPYPCMECGQKFDQYDNFHDHLKEVLKFVW